MFERLLVSTLINDDIKVANITFSMFSGTEYNIQLYIVVEYNLPHGKWVHVNALGKQRQIVNFILYVLLRNSELMLDSLMKTAQNTT